MQIVIDRFEAEIAMVELPDGTMANMDKRILSGFSEGDVILLEKDNKETDKRKGTAKKALAELFEG